MGNSKPVVEAGKAKKRKKKGRPSLIDLQMRSLRLQKVGQETPCRNPNPSPNPYLRFPSSTSLRRSTRRNPTADAENDDDEDEEEDDEDGSSGRRKEKKLRHVLHLPGNDVDPSASGSESDARRKRPIEAVVAEGKTEKQNLTLKATDPPQEPSDSGPTTTPLPDKKLLVFILDRLQKKDTYGVFSEPVDPEELPDYHDMIEHPMDFATIRKNLTGVAYANLEQFEKDVYLISSNAMRYNSPDTIYYRQARAIHELAKKSFENLRQESDNETEPKPEPPKPARRGRPPTKNIGKKIGRPPIERPGRDFSSSATLASAGNGQWSTLSHDMSRKGLDKANFSEVQARPYGLRNIESHSWSAEFKSDRNEDYSGTLKGNTTKYGKKLCDVDENRRMTYIQPQSSSLSNGQPFFRASPGERQQMVPVGLHVEYAHARSLARFAASLGPVGWEIAAKQIERVLPPGTKFGRGWVGENDTPQPFQAMSTKSPLCSSQPDSVPSSAVGLSVADQSLSNSIIEGIHRSGSLATPTKSATHDKSVESVETSELVPFPEGGSKPPQGSSGGNGIWQRSSFQLHQNPAVQTASNGFNNQSMLNQLTQHGKIAMPCTLESFGTEAMMSHSRALDMVSRNRNIYVNHAPANHFSVMNAADRSTSVGHDPNGPWQGSPQNSKPAPMPPDLNVGLQSPGSPSSGVIVDPQHANLALQL